jgi:hypothetical protein
MVCVVQIGSSTRTSACSTARSTFSWAMAKPAGAIVAAKRDHERDAPQQ